MAQFVTLNPNNHIAFMGGAKVSQLEIINSSPTKNIVFKIRTTQPLCFVVKPNSGIIDAMGRSKVDINFVQSGEVSLTIIREKQAIVLTCAMFVI